MKQVILFVIGFALFQTMYSQNEEHIDWNADLDYLSQELSEKHYNFFTIQSKDDFLSGINAIEPDSKNQSDFQIALKIQQVIAKSGDSHTMLNFSQLLDKNQLLPFHLFWASDGLYILHTSSENKEILGCQLLSINKFPITDVIDSLSTLFTVDNRAMVKMFIPQLLLSLQILQYFGFAASGQVELELRTHTNQHQAYVLKPSEMNRKNRISFQPDSISFSVKNENVFFMRIKSCTQLKN